MTSSSDVKVMHSGLHPYLEGSRRKHDPAKLGRAYADALMDWWLLGEADVLMASPDSSFGITASWRRCIDRIVLIPTVKGPRKGLWGSTGGQVCTVESQSDIWRTKRNLLALS